MTDKKALLHDLKIDRETAPTETSNRWIWPVSVLIVIALAGLGWWWTNHQDSAIVVDVVKPQALGEQAQNASVLDASGYIIARLRATVSSKITGKVVDVRIEEGMRVEQGQVLATLDNTTAQAAVAFERASVTAAQQALAEIEVQLRQALRDVRRTRELQEKGLAATSAVETDQSRVDQLTARLGSQKAAVTVAEKSLAMREQQLADTIIRAPFSGMVIAKSAQPGEMISPVSAGGGFTRTGICTIVDMESLEIEVDVNEAYIQRVRPEQPVLARLDAYPDWEIPARVIAKIPAADRQKATVRVRIAIDVQDPRILPEMGVKVAFLQDASASSTASAGPTGFRIPAATIRIDNGQEIVFSVRQGVVERRAIRTTPLSGSQRLITSGLTGSETLVLNPPESLKDADLVEIRAP